MRRVQGRSKIRYKRCNAESCFQGPLPRSASAGVVWGLSLCFKRLPAPSRQDSGPSQQSVLATCRNALSRVATSALCHEPPHRSLVPRRIPRPGSAVLRWTCCRRYRSDCHPQSKRTGSVEKKSLADQPVPVRQRVSARWDEYHALSGRQHHSRGIGRHGHVALFSCELRSRARFWVKKSQTSPVILSEHSSASALFGRVAEPSTDLSRDATRRSTVI